MLEGKVIVVTGSESGIGREIALACAAAGASLVVSGLVVEGLEQTAAIIAQNGGGPAIVMPADISDPERIDALYRRTLEGFGRLDAAVANAAAILPIRPLVETPVEDFEKIVRTNLTGTFLTLTRAARILIAQGGGGSLLAVGSSSAVRPVSGAAPYSASKGGIHTMMRTLALELAPHRIRVNTLVPGQTATPPMLANAEFAERAARALPMGELVQPVELGRYAAFALSDALPHQTGSVLMVDAGRTLG